VLAYGYRLDDSGELAIAVVNDANSPGREDIRLEMSISAPAGGVLISHHVAIARPVRGFFAGPTLLACRSPGDSRPTPVDNLAALTGRGARERRLSTTAWCGLAPAVVTGHGRIMTSPAEPPGPTLIRRASALAGGLSDNELRRARQRGTLTVVTRGVYLRTTEADELDGAARHVAAVLAVLPRLVGGPVVSHVSAAVVHGLPFWHTEMPAVHVTRDRSVKARRGPALQTHRASLHEDEVVIVAGLPVTSVARTVLDCARTLPFENAVVLADAALHRGLVTPAGLTAQLRRHARIPGARLVAAVVCFADGRSGHVGTSRSRVVLHRAGLPAPELRFPVVGGQGESLGCADFAYPASRVLGEFVPLDRNACPLGAAQMGCPIYPGQGPPSRIGVT